MRNAENDSIIQCNTDGIMHDLIDHLRKMGEDRVIDIFKVKRAAPDLFDRILRLFYVKRHPLSIKEICEDLDADYPVTHNIITKLVHIGMLALWYLPLQLTITKSIYHHLHTKWSLINCPDHARTE
jgi:hypothetical protein